GTPRNPPCRPVNPVSKKALPAPAGDVHARAQRAGKTRIGIWIRSGFVVPGVAACADNAVKPAVERATDLEAGIIAIGLSGVAPRGRPCGLVARDREEVPFALCAALRDNDITTDDRHWCLRLLNGWNVARRELSPAPLGCQRTAPQT